MKLSLFKLGNSFSYIYTVLAKDAVYKGISHFVSGPVSSIRTHGLKRNAQNKIILHWFRSIFWMEKKGKLTEKYFGSFSFPYPNNAILSN